MTSMTTQLRKALIPVVLVAVTAILYLPRLGTSPIYLMPDEVVVAVTAHSIAATGRDGFHDRFMPLYIEFNRLMVDHRGQSAIRTSWLPPMIFYAVALVLKVLPFSETSVRLPTAIVGIVDVLLMYFIGRRLFKNEWLAVLSAALLALTPAHFIHSRMTADYLYPVPFMLGWLLCMLTYVDARRKRTLFAGALCLGVGFYSYAASVLVMPLYLLMTFVVLLRERRPARSYLLATGAFSLPAVLCIPWLIQHPAMIAEVLTKYDLNGAGKMTALQSLRDLFTYHRIGDQIALYWAFFNPRFLFFDGPMELMFSTREVGVFLMPTAVLLLAGLFTALRAQATPARLLLLLGFFTAPLAATLVNVNDAIYRALEMLPFAALLAAWGAERLWSAEFIRPSRRVFIALGLGVVVFVGVYARHVLVTQARMPGAAAPLMLVGVLTIVLGVLADRLRVGQMIVLGLLAVAPIQFARFYVDYFTAYRVRSEIVFSGNIRGVFEEVLRQQRERDAPAIYLGEIGSYSYGPLYWKFYLIKHGRQDLAGRTVEAYVFYPDRVLTLPPGSLVVTNAGDGPTDALIDRLVAAGQFNRTVVKEPDGTPTYLVLRRLAGS